MIRKKNRPTEELTAEELRASLPPQLRDITEFKAMQLAVPYLREMLHDEDVSWISRLRDDPMGPAVMAAMPKIALTCVKGMAELLAGAGFTPDMVLDSFERVSTMKVAEEAASG